MKPLPYGRGSDRSYGRGSDSTRRARTRIARILALLAISTLLLPGCSDRTKRKWRRQSAETNYELALRSDDADVRRDAVARICESGYADRDDAFHVLDVAARTDPVTQIRCIAIRGLAAYRDDRPVGTMLTILQAGTESPEALPANDEIRWETLRALLALEKNGVLDGTQRRISCDICLALLEADPPRNVRLTALRALACFQERRVFQPLVRSLRGEPDFAVADTAEQSLIALTGVTHNYDADAWETWLANNPNPFEFAGRTPATTRPAGPSWWDKQTRSWRRAIKLNTE